MPWMEQTTMSLKKLFIQYVTEKSGSMLALCEEFGISRKTGYKWLRRHEQGGNAALEDQRRCRSVREKRYETDVWSKIFELRERFPTYGPRKLVIILTREYPEISWPSISSVKSHLRDQGYIIPAKERRKIVSERLPLREITEPNAVWCIDFKGWFITRDARRCEPLTLIDGYSRYLLACTPVSSPKFSQVKPELEKAFYKYGKPEAIRSDNGSPFGSPGFRGLSPLSVWLLKRGIFPEKITPGRPGENGRLERLHRTLKADVLRGVKGDYEEFRGGFSEFMRQYNEVRPHESLSDMTPSSVYRPSLLAYTGREEKYTYPDDYRKVRVNTKGYLSHNGHCIYLTESLAKEYVGIKEEEFGHALLFLGYPLGTLEQHVSRRASQKKRQP